MSSNLSRANYERQYKHIAVIAHGAHPEYRLEFDAEVDGTDTHVAGIFQGSVVSLNSNGKFVLGAGSASALNYPVPMISMKNIVDPDVTTGIGTFTASTVTAEGTTTYYSESGYLKNTYSAVGGKITAIPCTGSYEIETTEFYGSAFAPNDVLVAGTGDNIGKVGKATKVPGAGETVVGFVAKGSIDAKEYSQTRVSFFANFIPPTGMFAGGSAGTFTKVVVGANGAVTLTNA